MSPQARRVAVAAALVPLLVLVGVLGYRFIEGMSLIDSLYMTVITVGTVGFREVQPLSDAGKLFTIALIVVGVAVLGFSFGRFVEFLFAGELRDIVEGRRMGKRIEDLSGHTVVAGLGRVGTEVASQLSAEGAEFVIVDLGAESADFARERDWPLVLGDATDEETLQAAGIARAKSLVTALDTDAENLFVTVTARSLNPDIFIVARSSHVVTEPKLLKAGANRVITPNVIGGRRMAAMVLHPVVSDYLDLVAHGEGVEFRLQDVELPAGSRFCGMTIADARVRELTGAYILAIRKADGTVDTNPQPDSMIQAGDRIVVLGTPEQVVAFTARV